MNTESFDKVVQCDSIGSCSIGFQIAKEYFNWNNLSIINRHCKSSEILYLANIIDLINNKIKGEG